MKTRRSGRRSTHHPQRRIKLNASWPKSKVGFIPHRKQGGILPLCEYVGRSDGHAANNKQVAGAQGNLRNRSTVKTAAV